MPTGPQRAGFWHRFGGALLDGLLYGLLAAPFLVAAYLLIVAVGLDDCYRFENDNEIYCPPGAPNGGAIALGILVAITGYVIVGIVYIRALARTGQTWGRKIAGLRVVRNHTYQPIGVGRAIGRTLFANTISGWICYLGYLSVLWDRQKQTWHDKVTDSVVIKT